MAVATEARERAVAAESAPDQRVSRGDRLARTAIAMIGASLGYLVVRDGSPGWQVARLTIVVLLGYVTLVAFQRGGRAQQGGVAFAADQPITLRDAVAEAAPRPVLLIAGGAIDDEGAAGRHIQTGSPGTVTLWVVPDTGHTAALDTHPEQWEQRLTAFLADALAVAGSEDSP